LHAGWLWLLSLPALALVGAPFTSGAVAKAQLKQAIADAPAFWIEALSVVSLLAALATTWLMFRFLFLLVFLLLKLAHFFSFDDHSD